ncbi:hypothetical protein OUZ56_021190 [Daphnia magna]|uniref:Uncharacterized protein n=1 Tax=Daphnia magna TaxID=35525 RepID=A0ABQ9ZGN5_9CRUS|nr:hypothetical protein OUZ56_021190 [Daphnia magna]
MPIWFRSFHGFGEDIGGVLGNAENPRWRWELVAMLRVTLADVNRTSCAITESVSLLPLRVRVAEEKEIAVNPVLKEAKDSDDMGAQSVETETLCFR